MRQGRVGALGWTRATHPVLRWLPAVTLRRGVVLGVLGIVAAGVPVAWALSALDVQAMSFWSFVGFEALFAAGMAALVIALWALAEPAV